jgi:hypothetical protein
MPSACVLLSVGYGGGTANHENNWNSQYLSILYTFWIRLLLEVYLLYLITNSMSYTTLSHLDVFLLSRRLCCLVFKLDSFVMLFCLNKQRRKSPVFDVSLSWIHCKQLAERCRRNQHTHGFPQSDSIGIFTSILRIHTDQPEYKNLDYLLI